MTIQNTIDPVLAARAEKMRVLDAIDVTQRKSAKLERELRAAWSAYADAKPTTLAGAVELLREAGHYQPLLEEGPAAIIRFRDDFYGRIADRIEAGRVADVDDADLGMAELAPALALGDLHPMARMVANAVGFLRAA